jgi:hypothetical protein
LDEERTFSRAKRTSDFASMQKITRLNFEPGKSTWEETNANRHTTVPPSSARIQNSANNLHSRIEI